MIKEIKELKKILEGVSKQYDEAVIHLKTVHDNISKSLMIAKKLDKMQGLNNDDCDFVCDIVEGVSDSYNFVNFTCRDFEYHKNHLIELINRLDYKDLD